jgi:hypothetical protein
MDEAELAVAFNRETCRWTVLGSAAEARRSDERSRVIDALKKANGPMSMRTIMAVAKLKDPQRRR